MTIWASTDGSEEGRLAFHEWSAKAEVRSGRDRKTVAALLPVAADQARIRFAGLPGAPGRPGLALPVHVDAVTDFGGPRQAYRPAAARADEGTPDSRRGNSRRGHSSGRCGAGHRGASSSSRWTCGPSSIRRPCRPRLLPQVIEDFAIDRAATLGADVSGFAVDRAGGLCRGDFGRDQASAEAATIPNG